MADIESNIKVNIDTSDALAQLKLLQQQISAFQQAMRNAGTANAKAAAAMQQNLVNSINATGQFRANIQTIKTSAESFTEALEKNKLSIGEYFRYAGGASKSFGKFFKSEFATIQQVAVERVKTIQTQFIKLGRDANGAMKAISVRPLALDMDSLATKTQIAAQRQQLFNQLMKQGSTQLLNFGKNTQWAGRQLMVGFTIPLTMAGAAAAKAYMQIEQASIKFKRVYGDMNTTTAEANKMVKQVQSLANEFTKYGLAVADTMDMAAQAAAMGKTGADLLAQVNQASKLAVLGGVDQAQALETTISLTNAFGLAADKLSGSIDFLNAVENQTVLSIEDLTIAIPKAAPVIQQLGGDVKDLAFFMTAMKEGGINASEGANALKSGLASMINPTAKASQFLQSFGINIKGIVEANKGDIKGTVIGFAKALDTLDPLNRARAIEQMFGKFQFARISTLFKNVIDQGSQAARVAGLAKETAQELAILSEREMKRVSDSPMYKFQKAVQDMQAKLAPVGEAFVKAVTPVIEFVGKMLDGFNNMSEGAKQFATIATVAIAGIGPILLMTFGLIANGVANIMKLFVNLKSFFNKTGNKTDILGEQTKYMNSEQLKNAAIAASLDQAHAKLRQTFTSEAAAVDALTQAYKRAIQAQGAYAGIPGVPVGNAGTKPKKYAGGVSMVPGPKGAGDIVPALLSPGEAVIPAKQAQKYAPVISGMIAGNLPGFEEGTTGVGMRQSIIGPLTQKQTEGLARTAMKLDEISKEVMAGPYAKVAPTNYGTQISPSTGHSFPAFGVGGIYRKPDGTEVFVKPQIDLQSAMAEMRGTQIARDAHGLEAPKQKIAVMMDPTDPQNKRRFIVLESPVDEKFANIPTSFTKDQYIKQLVASLLRGDKDLGLGNLGGNVLADVGPAGVFQRASGKRELGAKINSMEEQAIINLLGVKGGAKRFFAEATSDIARSMTPAEFDAAMKAEIQSVMPRLQATIAGFGKMRPVETAAYRDMLKRLQAGLGVDWGKYQVMHSGVPPKRYAKGTEVVGFESPKNPVNFAKALASLSSGEILKYFRIQDTHLRVPLNIRDPRYLSQVQRVFPGATAEELAAYEPVSNLTAQLPGNMNQVMKYEGGYGGEIFGRLWHGLRHKLSKSAKLAGISLTESQAVEDEIGYALSRISKVNDNTVSEVVGEILGENAKVTDLPLVKRKLWQQALYVGGLRSKPKKGGGIGDDGLGNDQDDSRTNDIIMKMLQDGAVVWNKNKTGLVLKLASGAEGPRIASWNIDYFGHADKKDRLARIQDLAARRIAQEAAYGPTGWANNPNGPLPQLPRTLMLPNNWNVISKGKSREQQVNMLISMWRAGQLRPGTYDSAKNIVPAKKLSQLKFSKQDVEPEAFSNKKTGELAYDSSKLSKEPIALTPGKELETYNLMSQSIDGKKPILPNTALKFFNKLALQMHKGGMIPGYADGVFSVPGPKGAGDVVPAMLSPGEAVIPAKKAQKYQPLIQQMVHGELPGYKNSNVPPPSSGSPLPPPPGSIPGVQAPAPYVAPESSSGGLKDSISSLGSSVRKLADNLVAGGKQAATVVGGKVKSAAESAAYSLTDRYLNPNNDEMKDSKGVVRNKARVEAIRAKEAEEQKKISIQNQGIGREVSKRLEATDVEYKMAQQRIKELDELNEKQNGLNDLQKQEYVEKKTLIRNKRDALTEEIRQERAEAGTLITPGSTAENAAKAKADKKAANKETWGKMSGKFGQIGMTASMAAGALSMIPGPLGQIAGQAGAAIGGLSTLVSFINGPVSGAIVALVAVAGSMYLAIDGLNNKFKESVLSAQKSKEAIGASTAAIRKLSEFNKTVTAGELMDKVRANKLVGIGAAPGKTTFGESYIKSEQGQAFMKELKDKVKEAKGVTDGLIADYANQLSMAIASGAITDKQAASIAANVGAALGDTNFAFKVRAQVGDIIGPNGENLKKDPIKIAAIIEARSVEQLKTSQTNLSKATAQNRLWSGGENNSLNRNITAGGTIAAMSGTGAGIGAGIGAIFAPVTAGLSVAIGAVIGTIAGAITGYFTAMGTLQQQAEQAGKMAGAMIGDMNIALQQQKEIGDILDKQYMQKIEQARLEGNITEQKRLQMEYDQKRNKLADINKSLTSSMVDLYNTSTDTVKEALDTGAQAALEARYKDNPDQLMYLEAIKSGLNTAKDTGNISGGQRMLLQTEMISQNIAPSDMSKLVTLMTDKDMSTKVMKIVTDFGATTATQFGQTMGMIKDEKVQKEVALEVSSAGSSAEALDILDLVQKVEQFGGVISADVIVSYFQKNDAVADKVQGFMESFEQQGDKLTAEAAIKIDTKLDDSKSGNFDAKYFSKLKTKDRNQYLQVIESIIQVDVPTIEATPDFQRWLNDEGAKFGAFPGKHSKQWWVNQYAKQRAFKITSETPASALDVGGAGDKQPEAPKASFLDPYVESLRNASNWQQKLTVGFAASLKALRAQEGSLTKFAGLAERLKAYGADSNFIQAVLGGDQADIDKVIDRATGKLTKAGKDAIRIAKEVENAKIGMAYVIASPTERMEKDNELYQAGLSVIEAKEKKINDKYDKRIKALDEIGKIQDRNNQQQQATMDLADALSKGDIAAAARAALKAKQDSQKQALEDAKAGVENARQKELQNVSVTILGHTQHRSDLEKLIADNSERIAIAKKNELDRQIQIGKNAVIAANASAKLLANGKAIAGLNSSVGGGDNTGGNNNTDNTNQDNADTAAVTLTPGQIATSLAKTKKFDERNKSTFENLGIDEVASRKQTNTDTLKNLKSEGMMKKWIVSQTQADGSIKQVLADRGSVIDQAGYDAFVKKYNKAQNVVDTFDATIKAEKGKAFKTLPPEVQSALQSLKDYNNQKKAANQAYTDARTTFEAEATKKIGKDSSGNWKNIGPGEVNEKIYNQLYQPVVDAKAKVDGLVLNMASIDQTLASKGYTRDITEFYVGKRFARGGIVYASRGIDVESSKYALGTDTIPAMLTPGEFVMKKAAVDRIGSETLSRMNEGTASGESVYNYNITVNANSSDASDIADAVLREIKRVDSQRIRSSTI